MNKSSAFHASCHRRSSAAGKKHQAERAARMSPSHWWMARQLEGASLLLTHVCWVCRNPSEVYHFTVLFFFFLLNVFFLQRSPCSIRERGSELGLTIHGSGGLRNLCCFACENESVARFAKLNSLLRAADGTIHLPDVWSDKIEPNEEKVDLHVQTDKK